MTRAETVASLKAQADRHPDLKVKGKASAYLAVNGNMFAFVEPDGVFCLRLSPVDRQAYAAAGHNVADVVRYGAVMRDYVTMSPDCLSEPGGLTDWFDRSVAFARGLKPKPSKSRK